MSRQDKEQRAKAGYKAGRDGGDYVSRFFGVGTGKTYWKNFKGGFEDRRQFGKREAGSKSSASNEAFQSAPPSSVRRQTRSLAGVGTGGSGYSSASSGLPASAVVLLVLGVALAAFIFSREGPNDVVGRWSGDNGGRLVLRAGMESEELAGIRGGPGPNCFVWNAPAGPESIKFRYELTPLVPGQPPFEERKITGSGNLAHCFQGEWFSYKVRAISHVDQEIIAGWIWNHANYKIYPGFNTAGVLVLYDDEVAPTLPRDRMKQR